MRAPQFCVSCGGCCPATAGGRSSCFVRTVIRRAVTFTAGSGTVFRDGRTESGVSVGDAAHAPGCATLPKEAICVQRVSGDLGTSASCLALTETCHAPSCGFRMCFRLQQKRRRLDCATEGYVLMIGT